MTLQIKFTFVLLLPVITLMSACQEVQTTNDQGKSPLVRPAKIVSVLSSGLSFNRTYPGTLEAAEKAELAFRVSGQVSSLPARAGLRVKKGELLARLDDTDYRNSFDERKARFDLANIQHQQSKKLFKQKLSSQLQSDQSAAELKSAQAALDQARTNVDYTELLAPFDGVVAQVDIQNFQTVQAMSPIIKLQNDIALDIQFSVPETIISQLRRVEDPEVIESICGKVSFSAHPGRTFKACHKEHESIPDPVTRNYSAVFSLKSISELSLLPGMTASIEIDFTPFLADQNNQILFVPIESVFEKDGKQWVWKVDEESRAQIQEITPGRFENDLLEIKSGLSVQDKIIAAGVSFVRQGLQVKPLTKERGL